LIKFSRAKLDRWRSNASAAARHDRQERGRTLVMKEPLPSQSEMHNLTMLVIFGL